MANMTVPRFLLAVDPGLDVTGYAVYDRKLLGPGLTIEARCAPALLCWGRIATKPKDSIERRLGLLDVGLRDALTGAPEEYGRGTYRLPAQTAVVIERPADKAVYARNQRHGRDAGAAIHEGLAKLNYAIGALIVAAAGHRAAAITLQRTPSIPKARKSAIARDILTAWARARDVAVPPTIEDERDAILLGAWIIEAGPGQARIAAARAAAGVGQ
jgi:hypothetical protein